MEMPSIVDMLKAGMHFGHRPSKRHPKMEPYIFGVKSGINIINLEETQVKLKKALDYLEKLASEKGTVLFLGTKSQARAIIAKYAQECGMPYITERWLGGTFTNFSEIRKIINKLKNLKHKQKTGDLKKYTKKEQLDFTKEIQKLETMVGGLQSMEKVPEAIFIIDIRNEKTAITESIKKKVKVVAITDTNVNPEKVDCPIPGNDDAVKSIELVTRLACEAVKKGQASIKE